MKVFKYINLKVSTEFHQLVKIQAAEEGISMTEYINNKINKKETPEKKPQEKSKITLKEVSDAIEDVVTESMPLNPAPKDYKDRAEFIEKFNPQPKKGKK